MKGLSASLDMRRCKDKWVSEVAQSCPTLCNPMDCSTRESSLSITNSGSLWNSCPWWYHPTVSSSVVPFSSRLQSFPASGSFQMSQFFKSVGQSIGVSASASVLPMNIQDWSWTCSHPVKGHFYIFFEEGVAVHVLCPFFCWVLGLISFHFHEI